MHSFLARQHYLQLQRSVRFLQQTWRNRQTMRAARELFLRKRQAILTIQRATRTWLVYRTLKRQATVKIQACARQWLAQRQYLKTNTSAAVLQRWWRRHLAQRQRESAATIIQAHYRGHVCRMRYRHILSSVRTLQAYFRSHSLGQQVRHSYLQKREACISLQAAIRGLRVRKELSRLHNSSRPTAEATGRGCTTGHCATVPGRCRQGTEPLLP